jgi:hypothetical protein
MRKLLLLLVFVFMFSSITINCTNKRINISKTNEVLFKEINNEYKEFLFLKSEFIKFKQTESCLTRNLLYQRKAMLMLKIESKKNRSISTIALNTLNYYSNKSKILLDQRNDISIKKIRIYNRITSNILNYNNLVKKANHQELGLNGLPSFISSIDFEETFY